MTKGKITCLLVDDHALVRRGFRRMLEDDASIDVVGEASSGEEALKRADEFQPDVVVMDGALPGMNGLEATRRLIASHNATRVIMLSMHAEDTWVRQALDAGASGYILKSALDLDLVAAVKKVAAGETVLDPQLKSPEPALRGEKRPGLSPRELQVLKGIVDGKSTKEIATELSLSVNTVAVHRANIMDTLGIHKSAELVVYAIRNGLVNVR